MTDDLPLAKHYLEAISTLVLTGMEPDAATIDAFDAVFPRGTAAREAMLIEAHIALMVDAMPREPAQAV
ncbi:MAG: hypothetical protein ACM30D_04335 [Hyphomicrobiales bacterium]